MMTASPTMQIFRASEGKVSETSADDPTILPMSEATQMGFARLVGAGLTDGAMVKTLFDIPGFSLVYCWFKPNYPLARHSHKRDCMYYIVAGSIKLGTEWLGAGDGFFLPDATPYTYTIGDEGVEVLEFRHSSDINFKAFDATTNWWDKAEKAIRENHEAWLAAEPPRPALSA